MGLDQGGGASAHPQCCAGQEEAKAWEAALLFAIEKLPVTSDPGGIVREGRSESE